MLIFKKWSECVSICASNLCNIFFCLVLALCVRKLLIGSSQVFISNCGLRSPAHLLCKYLFAASQTGKKSRLEVKGNGTNTTCFRK